MSEPSATLTNAILAMDVYNRGANPGLVVNFNTIGNYQVHCRQPAMDGIISGRDLSAGR